ncbi:hypothetical protein SU69_02970 [Thermosipho melanesiensis]|uniref:Tetratricopeptide domain protein n=2 Tax=Thermosipho melanesiensis TaxID=46541 RepID=A6LKJ6_THEM4|nr:hypothetical protein [Thermosipho melanesiensis]ABR30447.1 Tetratricopeptide domain protein [Thermosipho melanesiensis BI429]APT73607.1 hypothetical protein BW47_03095 [Thermosipho melanesiensis]OOC37554.1 hypothetical protein SU68_02990 [Thermosipho melanesiensis]OOC39450.1 hypothetical protein SU69_02970 [Thermosipho melanesiensis]OOC39513.1 hypothetical protein SU70_02970 [Thermosipho melanesiensis]
MRKLGVLFCLILSIFLLANVEDNFIEARKNQDVELIKVLISQLENTDNYLLFAESLMEYALWGAGEDEDKEALYEKALEYAKKAIEKEPENGRAYYVAGAIIGRLAQYKGIVKSLFMLGDFDKYTKKAIELTDDKFYKALSLLAMGMRYRDVPWPLCNYKKSEEYLLKALEILPNYPNIHLEMGKLYEKWGKKELAIKEYELVLKEPPHPLLLETDKQAKEEASELLEKLK